MPKTTKEVNQKSNEVLSSKNVSNNKNKSNSKAVVSKTSDMKSKSKVSKTATSKSKKSVASKKVTSKKTPSKKTVSKKTEKNIKSKDSKIDFLEYYDLPYRYNKTIVKILAQTPKTLFVYWDISDEDRKSYIKQYGENFFSNTRPVLIIHNTTMNYTFEIEINDFANCWYFNINDEKCDYLVELGRRPKADNLIPHNYLYITSSNKIESPNGHILFEKEQKTLYFRNVKTNQTNSKDIANLEFIEHFGRIYNIYDMYKKIYKDENLSNLNNPSSQFN